MKMNPWAVLFIAGLFEVVWAIAMDYSDGFTIWYYDIIVAVFLIGSTVLLAKALKMGIPVGTAYAVWTGIGAVGTVLVGILFFHEPATFWRLFFITTLIASIVGLKIIS